MTSNVPLIMSAAWVWELKQKVSYPMDHKLGQKAATALSWMPINFVQKSTNSATKSTTYRRTP